MKNAEWLENINDRLAEATHFAALAQQMKSAGISMNEMDTLQGDLLNKGVKGNLQQVQPDQLSPAQKLQLQQLQQQIGPVNPTGTQSERTVPGAQGAIISDVPLANSSTNAGTVVVRQPATLAVPENRPVTNPANTVVMRMLPSGGPANIIQGPTIMKFGGSPTGGNSGWTSMSGGHLAVSAPSNAGGGGSLSSAIPSPISSPSTNGNFSMKAWVGDSDDPDRDSDTRWQTVSGAPPQFGGQIAPPRTPATSAIAATMQRGPHDGQITGQMISGIPSSITGPTSTVDGNLVPPPSPPHESSVAFSIPGVLHDGDQSTNQIGNSGSGTPGREPENPDPTVAFNASGTLSDSQGVSDGGVQHSVAVAGPGIATNTGGDSSGTSRHVWHYWNGQSNDGSNDSSGNDANDWTPPNGWSPGSDTPDDGSGWSTHHAWQDTQGNVTPWTRPTGSAGAGLTPATGQISVSTAIVPEPAAGMIVVSGVMLMLLRRRRREAN